MAEAVASPVDVPAQRDSVASAALQRELDAAGIDLTGLTVLIYPLDSAESFVFIGSDDSTALLSSDDGGEGFVELLLDSPTLERSSVEQVVMQHTGNDEEGTFVMSIIVSLADIERGMATGEDITDRLLVQMERIP